MLALIVVSAIASATDARIQATVLDALGKQDCAARIYGALDPHFAAQAPITTWRQWCAGVGVVNAVGASDASSVQVDTTTGRWMISVAFSDSGKIAGLGAAPMPASADKRPLADILEEIRAGAGVPSLAVLVVDHGKMTAEAHTGVRKVGDPTLVTADDVWHLGSDTKAMTGALAGMLVDAKLIAWETTIGDVFKDWSDIHPQLRDVRLDDLLSHMSGLPQQIPDWSGKTREAVIHNVLTQEPGPRTYGYSNVGYMTAGLMLERVARMSWEDLMRTSIFGPLGMSTCGFGPPATPAKVDNPWGHRGKNQPVGPGRPGADNPAALGPAGTVHCSLSDWSKFVTMEMHAAAGGSKLLSQASAQKAFTATRAPNYGFGWIVSPDSVAHAGSNTMFYVLVVAQPAKDRAFFVATNAGEGEEVTGRAMTLLRDRFGK